MKKRLLYIFGVAATMLTSCSEDMMDIAGFLNGTEKTPIAVSLNFDDKQPASRATSRAANGAFEANDQLVAYFRHVKEVTPATDPVTYDVVKSGKTGTPDLARLVNLKVSALTTEHYDKADNYTNHAESSTLTCTDTDGLYWDDFSEGGKGDATDLRTDDHYLQSYYGYCYNGGTPSIALGADESHKTEDGKIQWTVATNQSSTNTSDQKAFQHSDLLFSPTQTPPVAYDHGTNNTITGRDRVLTLSYTHAMSMVTVEVVCSDGFDAVDQNFNSALVKLNSVNTVSEVNAPSATVTPSTTAEVTLQKGTVANDKLSCTFSAIIAPSLIKADAVNPFITLEGIDGNNYNVFLTDAILTTSNKDDEDSWSEKLAIATSTSVTPTTMPNYNATHGGISIPGVNYYIKLTLKKQAISVSATIRPWAPATASADGKIDIPNGDDDMFFEDDEHPGVGSSIEIHTVDKNRFVNQSEFSIYTLKHDDGTDTPSERTDEKYKYATICKYVDDNSTNDEDHWVNTPEIYWPNVSDKYYFRALALLKNTTGSGNSSVFTTTHVGTYDTNKGLVVSQGKASEHDIIWATTPRHYGRGSDFDANDENTYRTYEKNAAIPPRKGGVPLAFDHAMTKVTFNLADKNKDATVDGWETNDTRYQDYDNPLNPRINLAGAKIQITNLSTTGTIAIEDGKVTATAYTSGCKVFGDGTGYNPALLNGTANTITDDLLKEFIMVPQSIDNAAILTVTLADGTKYKIQLNTCLDADDSVVNKWERGKHYTYTIHLEKDKITFRAMIKDWEPVDGGGKATLEWD